MKDEQRVDSADIEPMDAEIPQPAPADDATPEPAPVTAEIPQPEEEGGDSPAESATEEQPDHTELPEEQPEEPTEESSEEQPEEPPGEVDEITECLNAFEDLYRAVQDGQDQAEENTDDILDVNAKKTKKKKLGSGIATVLAVLFFAAALGGVLYYTVFPAQGFFHSDTADTIMWANASHESGRLISRDFGYAALLPTGGSLLMQPWISLFGLSMNAHVIGMVSFVILFAAALWFLLRSIDFPHGWSAFLTGVTLLLLSGSDKLREIMWGHVIYYSLGPIYLILILSLVLRYLKHMDAPGDKGKTNLKSNIFLGLTCLASIAAAINGFQILALVAFPVICAIVLERLFDKSAPLWNQRSVPPLFAAVSVAVSSGIGMLLLSVLSDGIVAGYANAYSNYSGIENWKEHLLGFAEHWFTLLGVDVHDGSKLFSIESVGNMIGIAFGVILVAVPAAAVVNIRKIENKGLRMVIWAHTAASGFVLFGYICGGLSAANWRLTPVAITSVIVTLGYLKYLAGNTKFPRIQYGILAVVLCFACMNFYTMVTLPPDYGRDNELHALAYSLEERGLTYGYASFWNANSTTVISDSKVKVRNINVNEGGIFKDGYQASLIWYIDQPGVDRYFVALDANELNILTTSPAWPVLNEMMQEQYEVRGFTVSVFDQNIPFN